MLFRVSIVEQSAIRELKEKLYANKNALMEAFQEVDKDRTGKVLLFLKMFTLNCAIVSMGLRYFRTRALLGK